jgi:molybdate transport system substrate-binding protein
LFVGGGTDQGSGKPEKEDRTGMNMGAIASRTAALVVAAILSAASAAFGDEVRVMASGAFTAAYLELVPEFERATRNTVVTSFGGSLGNGPETIPNRLQRGEPADLVILAASALDNLIKQGKVVAGSRVDLVRSSIGMAVRAGASRPDISSVAALRQTLLRAKSIAYSASASGVYISTELFQRLGIADQVLAKSKNAEGQRVAALVARGEAEIGFQQISELVPEPGIDYVGPLPPEVQRVTVFSAGIVVGAKKPEQAKELIKFLASENAISVIKKTGLEPVGASVAR